MKLSKFTSYLTLTSLILTAGAEAQVQKPASEEFNFGIIVPLTGDLAQYGTAIKNGFELAKTESPKKLEKIRFIYEDSRYDGKAAVDGHCH